jgi:hypothetical protein
MATHSRVLVPVVSHSQSRKKWLAMGWRLKARWAWWRCRKIVTLALVTWVNPNTMQRSPHPGRSINPLIMYLNPDIR